MLPRIAINNFLNFINFANRKINLRTDLFLNFHFLINKPKFFLLILNNFKILLIEYYIYAN